MNKYKNKKCEYRKIKFDSRKEMMRYIELESLQKQGKISHLQCQAKMKVAVKDKFVCSLILDFVYLDSQGKHYEDVKAFDLKTKKYLTTPAFKLKRKLVEAQYGIKIELF